MGWEYTVTLNNNNYEKAIDALYHAFHVFTNQYTLVRDNTGFTLIKSGDPKWPAIQISINTADEKTYGVPCGEKYLYCLFYISGDKAWEIMECIKNTLNKLNYQYAIDDL